MNGEEQREHDALMAVARAARRLLMNTTHVTARGTSYLVSRQPMEELEDAVVRLEVLEHGAGRLPSGARLTE